MAVDQGEERKRGPGRPKKIPLAEPEVVPEIVESEISSPPPVSGSPVLCFMQKVNQFSMYRDEGNVHIRAVREDGTIVDEIISLAADKSVSVSIT